MFEKDVYNYFNLMILKFFKSTNSEYNDKLSNQIVSILLNEDETSKQLFFDFFKNISSNDKDKIVKTCIYEVINRINYVVKNSDMFKINYITNLIKMNNRNLVVYIHNFLCMVK
ncbi:MAG: hypothetical protein NC181_02250 [Clostridium sp.]|nr:hypothetical protein [Clostridium sp.]MCM1443706.1 hypothetical protein [Candidatus Amulumruptor caecigallinarius]